jgi:hypothetical protein
MLPASGRSTRRRGPGLASEILGLTKIDWNSNSLRDVLPTTLDYVSTLAKVSRRTPTSTTPRSSPFQLFV